MQSTGPGLTSKGLFDSEKMAGGPILQAWEAILPLVKDLRVRFALAMVGNLVALWFLVTYFKRLIPNLPQDLIS